MLQRDLDPIMYYPFRQDGNPKESMLNTSGTAVLDPSATGRPFSGAFAAVSQAGNPAGYHHAGNIPALHSVQAGYNLQNMQNALPSRTPGMGGVPTAAQQPPVGPLGAGRYGGANVPQGLPQQLSHTGLHGHGTMGNRSSLGVGAHSFGGMNGLPMGAGAGTSGPGGVSAAATRAGLGSGMGVGVNSVHLGAATSRITAPSSVGMGGSSMAVGGGAAGAVVGLSRGLSMAALNVSRPMGSVAMGAVGAGSGMGVQPPPGRPVGPSQPVIQQGLGMSSAAYGGPQTQELLAMLSNRGALRKASVNAMVHQNQEFSIQQEDFPALPGFKGSGLGTELTKEQHDSLTGLAMQAQHFTGGVPSLRAPGLNMGQYEHLLSQHQFSQHQQPQLRLGPQQLPLPPLQQPLPQHQQEQQQQQQQPLPQQQQEQRQQRDEGEDDEQRQRQQQSHAQDQQQQEQEQQQQQMNHKEQHEEKQRQQEQDLPQVQAQPEQQQQLQTSQQQQPQAQEEEQQQQQRLSQEERSSQEQNEVQQQQPSDQRSQQRPSLSPPPLDQQQASSPRPQQPQEGQQLLRQSSPPAQSPLEQVQDHERQQEEGAGKGLKEDEQEQKQGQHPPLSQMLEQKPLQPAPQAEPKQEEQEPQAQQPARPNQSIPPQHQQNQQEPSEDQQQESAQQQRPHLAIAPGMGLKDAVVKGGAGAAPDRYGLLGLLNVIRMSDPDLTMLALGTDLTTLGLNLNSRENLYKTFASPWADVPTRGEPEFSLPQCYIQPAPRLQPGYFSKFQQDTLFYIFYSMPGDEAQVYAGNELCNRGWTFHKELQMWLTRVMNTEPLVKTGTYERGSYFFFDPSVWETVRKDNYILHYDMLEQRPSLPPPER